ncbi:MAG: polyprenyl synthetase family protein [bacterium]|nr:polyprenyl synthetase family protein [bacterium]
MARSSSRLHPRIRATRTGFPRRATITARCACAGCEPTSTPNRAVASSSARSCQRRSAKGFRLDHDLDKFISDSAQRVDHYLDKSLAPVVDPPEILHEAMRYAVFSGGKRLRPAICFGAAVAAGASPDAALPAAAAVELVHAYSLVHDDLPCMDDDDERRGRPTAHVRFGEANALLAGDALLTEAFAQLGSSDRAAPLVAQLARAAGSRELIGGQVDDLGWASGTPTFHRVVSVHLRKTAALFRFSALAGGTLAGLAGTELESLDHFGRAYGLAFQTVDDLDDQGAEECSILQVMTPNEARARASELVEEALEACSIFGDQAWVLTGVAEALVGRLP